MRKQLPPLNLMSRKYETISAKHGMLQGVQLKAEGVMFPLFENRIGFANKYLYAKSTVISLFLHGILIGCLVMLGPFNPIREQEKITAIEVDIVPAPVVAAKITVPPIPPEPPAPSPAGRVDSRPAAAAARTAFLPPAIPGEVSDTSVAVIAAGGTGMFDQTTAVGQTGKQDDGKGEGNGHDSGVRIPPSFRSGAKPAYPQAARKARWEGTVVVRVLINTDGSVASAALRESSGYDVLDESAVQAVSKWSYTPAKKGGVPITSYHDVKVRFRLDEAE